MLLKVSVDIFAEFRAQVFCGIVYHSEKRVKGTVQSLQSLEGSEEFKEFQVKQKVQSLQCRE